MQLVVREMIDRHSSRRDNFRRHLFALLGFEIWHTEFVDRGELDLTYCCVTELVPLRRSEDIGFRELVPGAGHVG